MIRRPPRSTRTYTLVPYTTLFRSRIWLLLGARAGDRAQVEILGTAVAQAQCWSCATKRIVTNGLFRIPNLLLGATLLSVDRAKSDRLAPPRSEEHTSELQSLMRTSYAVFCLKKKKQQHTHRQ